MKGVKGKFLNKLKTIKTIEYLKPERILNVYAADAFTNNLFAKSINKVETNSISEKEVLQIENKSSVSVQEHAVIVDFMKSSNKDETHLISEKEVLQIENKSSVSVQEHEVIDVSDLMKDLEDDDESDTDSIVDDKENLQPMGFDANSLPKTEFKSFRPPDLNSSTLFDPNLLAAFKQAVLEVKAQDEERRNTVLDKDQDQNQEPDGERPSKVLKLEETDNPFFNFEKICPPGGRDSVILYTTGFRSIRKTFEDCASVRFLLNSFGVLYHERDLSMHMDFKDELFRILGEKSVPPRLFINGRYIGGSEEVLRLHEQGKFRPLLSGIRLNASNGPCEGCGGVRFVVCDWCSGSRKVYSGDVLLPEKCTECNENGLIICPICI